MKTQMTSEQLRKRNEKKLREIARWEKEKARPQKAYYIVYLVFIISLVYITDEVASQIGPQMKTEMANDMLSRFGDKSVGVLDILGMIAVPFQALAIFYKPLADRFGRKVFLVINTFGMGLGMFFVFLSQNIVLYVIGTCVIQFFVPHDMQVVYIMESAPPKIRARIYSTIKCIATLGVLMIPLLRRSLMGDTSQWRIVYLVPAVIGMVTSLVALMFARETDAFIDSRLRYLKMNDEEIEKEKAEKNAQNVQGGIIPSIRFVSKHKQLKSIFVASIFANTGFVVTLYYQVIMSYGYANNSFLSGSFATMDEALENASAGAVTAALFLFPVGSALAQLIVGYISDLVSRKAAAVALSAVCTVSLIAFSFGSSLAWPPYLVGFLAGVCIGSFWSIGDIAVMMLTESSPTNLRSSIVSAQFLAIGAGVVLSYGIGLPLITIFGNSASAAVSLGVAVPGFIITLIVLMLKTHDTKGLDLNTVTGCEWD